jgi:hypothetical protein
MVVVAYTRHLSNAPILPLIKGSIIYPSTEPGVLAHQTA